ncbi:hypothetical protein QE152_g24748 [Popillia japonica]|uniref:Uncharacterized protein n=1 Tax=Popillia japonica TaxID=7064 RepID=A0AAW1K2T4_POPJA
MPNASQIYEERSRRGLGPFPTASGKKYEIKDLQKQDTQRRYGQAIKENLELQDIPIEDNIKDKWNKIEMVLQGAATKEPRDKKLLLGGKKGKRGYYNRAVFYKSKTGELMRDKKLLLGGKKGKRGYYNRAVFYKKRKRQQKRRGVYFEELIKKGNDNRRGEECIGQARTARMETIDPSSLEDVKRVIASKKESKSQGENGISSEMIKRGGDILQSKIAELIVQVWRKEKLPEA